MRWWAGLAYQDPENRITCLPTDAYRLDRYIPIRVKPHETLGWIAVTDIGPDVKLVGFGKFGWEARYDLFVAVVNQMKALERLAPNLNEHGARQLATLRRYVRKATRHDQLLRQE